MEFTNKTKRKLRVENRISIGPISNKVSGSLSLKNSTKNK